MATVRFVLGIICLAFFGQFIEPNSHFLRREGRKDEGLGFSAQRLAHSGAKLYSSDSGNRSLSTVNRELILRIAQSQMGVREATGNNDGVAVEKYLKYTGNKKGEPWCASFVSWVYGKAGYVQPRTAWSPALFPLARQAIHPLPADVFGIYFPKLKRIAHCGLVEKQQGNWITTIEGNTNIAGNREGDGVYRRLRHRRHIKSYANWIEPERKEVMP